MITDNQQQAENPNQDYDPFLKWRPQTISSSEQPAQNEEEDLDPFAKYRPSKQPTEKKKEKKEMSVDDVTRDIIKQTGKGLLIGAGGVYGDLTDLLGLGEQKGQRDERSSREFQALERMEQPNYVPTYHDIETATGSSGEPQPLSFPTSEQVESGLSELGVPEEAETSAGRYAGNAAKIFGQGLAFGQINPLPAAVAGVAGEAVKDLGGGELAKAATEIVALIATPGQLGRKLVGSAKQEVQSLIKGMRDLGYTEEQITLAINSASKGKVGGIKAHKGAATEKVFEEFAEHSDALVKSLFNLSVPGIKKGPEYVHELASTAYGNVAEKASRMKVSNRKPFIDAANDIALDLMENLGEKPEAKQFIERLQEALDMTRKDPTGKAFINFYKELNSVGKWATRDEKDRWLKIMKNGVVNLFEGQGPQGKQLAKEFKQVNKGIETAYKAEEAFDLLQKATTQEGINYKKMYKLFDDIDNTKLFKEVLGTKNADNWQKIAKVGKEVENFDKAWKATHILKGSSIGDIARGGAASYYFFKGDLEGLAGVVATKAGSVAVKKLAEKALTDPRYQNLMIKGLHALKENSSRTLGTIINDLQKYFDEDKIDLKA